MGSPGKRFEVGLPGEAQTQITPSGSAAGHGDGLTRSRPMASYGLGLRKVR